MQSAVILTRGRIGAIILKIEAIPNKVQMIHHKDISFERRIREYLPILRATRRDFEEACVGWLRWLVLSGRLRCLRDCRCQAKTKHRHLLPTQKHHSRSNDVGSAMTLFYNRTSD